MRKERDSPGADVLISRIAAHQHGVVSADQIRSTRLSPAGVTRRVDAGRLHRIHRGVYAVGHPRLSERGRWMAAVLACGEGAVLSHLSAAELWGVRRPARRLSDARGRSEPNQVHVTAPSTAGKRKRDGIILHRSSTLTARHCTRADGIPVTGPTRTLEDIRSLLSPAQFNAAVREAEFLRLPTSDRYRTDGTRTELEQRMLALCRRHRLPRPEVNSKLDHYEVDFFWPAARLVVEVDGWDAHRSRSAFEEDRARDARLALLGYEVVRFTWRQLTADRRAIATAIRRLVEQRAG